MTHTKTTAGRMTLLAAVATAGLALSACDRQENASVGQKMDNAIERTEQAAREGAKDAKSSMESAASTVRDAGEKAAVAIDDTAITAAVSAGLAKDPDLSAIRVDVETKNGVVTLQGPAPSENARARAAQIAQGVKGVSSVNNQLMVKAS
ncbi:MAG: BON domain-containing protein [Burkholderiales bacterium]|nr:MAG: BON domain-containing protein [Burkholderiales bacterium]